MTHVLMVAAENDSLPAVDVAGREVAAKVGGIGDVVRDLPPALGAHGCKVSVVIPAYGVFTRAPGCMLKRRIEVPFAGDRLTVGLYEVPGRRAVEHVRHFVLDHTQFAACGAGRIYCNDPPLTPFGQDATKFALLCAATAACVSTGGFGEVDVIHLHDWHAAWLAVLRRYHPGYRALKAVRCVYTIHNLSLQGIRPFRGDGSSLRSWFPDLRYDEAVLADPRWTDCINPMAAGIRLADAVNTVSPSYAEAILKPSAVEELGFYGGEGLERDLRDAKRHGRLFGILNGLEYPPLETQPETRWRELLDLLRTTNARWIGDERFVGSAHYLAHRHLMARGPERPAMLVTSVGRVTQQKLGLLRGSLPDGRPVLEALLDILGSDGLFLLLGSGDPDYEQFLTSVAAQNDNFVFLRGYSEALASAMYRQGDLFMMPSSFEPCGISQLLALRAGQPCLVHAVGGLKDTVEEGHTGFTFDGRSLAEQTRNLVTCFIRACSVFHEDSERWAVLRANAGAARFTWEQTADAYMRRMYRCVD